MTHARHRSGRREMHTDKRTKANDGKEKSGKNASEKICVPFKMQGAPFYNASAQRRSSVLLLASIVIFFLLKIHSKFGGIVRRN